MGLIGCPKTSVNNYKQRCVISQKSEDLIYMVQKPVHEVAWYTDLHVICNILTAGKLLYPAILCTPRCWRPQLLLYFGILSISFHYQSLFIHLSSTAWNLNNWERQWITHFENVLAKHVNTDSIRSCPFPSKYFQFRNYHTIVPAVQFGTMTAS